MTEGVRLVRRLSMSRNTSNRALTMMPTIAACQMPTLMPHGVPLLSHERQELLARVIVDTFW